MRETNEEVAATGSSCCRQLVGCLCLLFVSGPVLFIVGIVLFLTPNTRDADVQQYNDAVTQWDSTAVTNAWTSGTIGGSSFSVKTAAVTFSGPQDGIAAATSVFAESFPITSMGTYALFYNVSSVVPFTRSVALTASRTAAMTCTSSLCTNPGCRCYFPQMASRCSQISATGYVVGIPSSCAKGSACGQCMYTVFLTTFAAVVQGAVQDPTLLAARYPFTASSQTLSTVNMGYFTGRLYSSKDPFIAAQRVTKGAMDFGMTALQQRVIAIALIVVGVVVTALVCVCLVAGWTTVTSGDNKVGDSYVAPPVGEAQQPSPPATAFQQQQQQFGGQPPAGVFPPQAQQQWQWQPDHQNQMPQQQQPAATGFGFPPQQQQPPAPLGWTPAPN